MTDPTTHPSPEGTKGHPQASPRSGSLSPTEREKRDELLDHIDEYTTLSEGVCMRVDAFVEAVRKAEADRQQAALAAKDEALAEAGAELAGLRSANASLESANASLREEVEVLWRLLARGCYMIRKSETDAARTPDPSYGEGEERSDGGAGHG